MKISQEQADAVLVSIVGTHGSCDNATATNSLVAQTAFRSAFRCPRIVYQCIPDKDRRAWSDILHALADAVGPAEEPPKNSLDGRSEMESRR